MREIKFRAWNKDEKRFDTDRCYIMQEGWVYEHERHPDHDLESCDHLIIQQYTGLKDKNGKEIYEGDILSSKWQDCKLKEVIEWDTLGCRFRKRVIEVLSHSLDSNATEGSQRTVEKWMEERLEIIGNIYSNPELLKDI